MDDAERKLYEWKARVLQAAGHATRLAIMDLLREGERCVCDIAAAVGSERSNVSRHLAVMLHAGLLDCRKDGLRVMYSLRCPCIGQFLECISEVLREQVASARAVLRRL